jgi:hypothetical protein
MVNARNYTKHSPDRKSSEAALAVLDVPPLPPPLRPQCGIWAEPGRVEVMFRLDQDSSSYSHVVVEVPNKGSLPAVSGRGSDSIPIFVTVTEAAQLCGYRAKTFYNWIETGKLRLEHGLRRFGRECRIEWKSFKVSVDRGEFADVRKVK